VSGPATDAGEVPAEGGCGDTSPEIELTPSREAEVGRFRVRRALPRRARRTIGAWCFADHMGPATVTEDRGLDVGPHPHIGLQTVTWLISGEALHRDSLGSEQVIAPGQLNLMTAGHGIAHSEEATGRYAGELQGIQLWVAQPEETRHGEAAFEHHAELPRVEVGDGTATVLVGALDGQASPARRDTDHLGVDLDLAAGEQDLALEPALEHGIVVLQGRLTVEGHDVEPGMLAYLGVGHDECRIATDGPTRAMLLGGSPFEDQLVMWWNYVGRTRDEISDAHRAWTDHDTDRFGDVPSPLPRIDTGPPPWGRSDG
jgi:redox-sensitive bicupin YhaK (pirin superfamily)